MIDVSKIAVFTIATNKYYELWKKMVKSADRNLFLKDDITFHVFSNFDQNNFNIELSRVNIVFYKIPDLRWPHATLYRYKYIYEYGQNLDFDYFVHIDADMLIVPHESEAISSILASEEVGLVMHPGYWRIEFPERFYFYLNNLRYFLKDTLLIIKYGNLGTWSKNKNSKAFVERYRRKKYFCGAVWMGKKAAILQLAQKLSELTDSDLMSNSIPSWNDESYLNYWATRNRFKVLNPSFCYDQDYKNLEYLNPKIIALDKNKLN